MFRDQYRRDNDKIEPDRAMIKYLSVKMKEAQNAPVPEKKRGRQSSALALAACFVFILTGVFADTRGKWNGEVVKAYPDGSGPVSEAASSVPDDTSYAALYALLQSLSAEDTAANAEAKSYGTAKYSAADSGGYSRTNVQVDGVDEADVVKTDGTYIYVLQDHKLTILRANGGHPEIESSLTLPSYDDQKNLLRPKEIYVQGDRLIVLQGQYEQYDRQTNGAAVCDVIGYGTNTQAVLYDISDRTHPALLRTWGQSGNYLSSRLIGNTLYLLSNYTVSPALDEKNPETFVPMLYDGDSGSAMTAGDICICADPERSQYAVVTAADVQTGERLSSKSVLGCGSTVYANEENLYIASTVTDRIAENAESSAASSSASETVTEKTDLIRIALNGGQVTVAASGSVPGALLNQYSMDEYNGTFRVVTTASDLTEKHGTNGSAYVQSDSNALYTLDQDLGVLGRITDVAPGERVYSVRFNGPIGYFVTFRQVDPLFAVDLSDPAHPKILSALKIPGLSDYLHPYSDGLLFGLGRDADSNTGHVNGLKLSMFDIADPANVTEKNKLLLDERWSVASYNFKAIVVSAEKGLIAFPADDRYLVFSYSAAAGFTQKAELGGANDGGNARGLFIGDVFYVVTGSELTAYRMDDYKALASVKY